MKEKKVSVIMGIYNCASTLDESIGSILNQSYSNWELIMCDDGSMDDTYQKALFHKKKYGDRIILLRNEHNMGLNYTLNKCLEVATGDYVARMDGDDISLPTRFEKEVKYLEEHSEMSKSTKKRFYTSQSGALPCTLYDPKRCL